MTATWERHEEQRRARAAREIRQRVEAYRDLTTDELRSRLRGASPWERAAIRRVLKDRGEAE